MEWMELSPAFFSLPWRPFWFWAIGRDLLAYPLTRGSACSFQFQRLSWHLKEQGSVCVSPYVHVGLLFLLLLKIFRFKTLVFQYLWKWFGFLWHYPSSVGDDERMRPGCWVIYKPLDFYVFLFAWWDILNVFIVEATKSHAVSRNTTCFFSNYIVHRRHSQHTHSSLRIHACRPSL
jgi:hypothetical protein